MGEKISTLGIAQITWIGQIISGRIIRDQHPDGTAHKKRKQDHAPKPVARRLRNFEESFKPSHKFKQESVMKIITERIAGYGSRLEWQAAKWEMNIFSSLIKQSNNNSPSQQSK